MSTWASQKYGQIIEVAPYWLRCYTFLPVVYMTVYVHVIKSFTDVIHYLSKYCQYGSSIQPCLVLPLFHYCFEGLYTHTKAWRHVCSYMAIYKCTYIYCLYIWLCLNCSHSNRYFKWTNMSLSPKGVCEWFPLMLRERARVR